MKLNSKQKRELLSLLLDYGKRIGQTVFDLLGYTNEPEYIADAGEYLHGFKVIRDLINEAETKAKAILRVEGEKS